VPVGQQSVGRSAGGGRYRGPHNNSRRSRVTATPNWRGRNKGSCEVDFVRLMRGCAVRVNPLPSGG